MYQGPPVAGGGRSDLESSHALVIGLIIDVPTAVGGIATTATGTEPFRVSVVEQRSATRVAWSFEGECGCPDDCPRDHANE